MRKFQITVFVLATAALIAAACCIGKAVGDEFRKVGMAALLFDVVCIQLWPTTRQTNRASNGGSQLPTAK